MDMATKTKTGESELIKLRSFYTAEETTDGEKLIL